MGRRAKNKQGDPLPLHADPDLNGSSKAWQPKAKPRPKGASSTPNLRAKLGKRKPERDDDGERATKKPKGVPPAGKPKSQTKAAPTKRPIAKGKGKPNGTRGNPRGAGVTGDDGSVTGEDVEDVDMQAEARSVCLSEDLMLHQIYG
jgi:hypothetical protein